MWGWAGAGCTSRRAGTRRRLHAALDPARERGRHAAALEAHTLLAEVYEVADPAQAITHLRSAQALERTLRDEFSEQLRDVAARAQVEQARREVEHERALRTASEEARQHAEATIRAQLEALERGRLYDELTGLPNRFLLGALLTQAVDRARRTGERLAVGLLDLDRFQHVNETFGHAAGDAALQQVVERLTRTLREGDRLARIGGDEFMLILHDVPDEAALNAIARRLLAAMRPEFTFGPQSAILAASIGLASFPAHGATSDELQSAAVRALRSAKASGGGAEISGTSRPTLAPGLETGLVRALERGEFELHYQPIVGARSGHPEAAEALLRWNSAELGRRSPAEFIPLLERNGLIVPVGAWALREACRAAARWGGPRVSVNLSARQFSGEADLRASVEAALADSGLPGERLELEITESLMVHSPERAAGLLEELRGGGVRIMLDDFGTGYSSLSYLERFPLDGLKIDRSYVTALDGNPRVHAILRATVQMCEALGLDVVAEGLETPEQREQLAELGVTLLQGYHFGRPQAGWSPGGTG